PPSHGYGKRQLLVPHRADPFSDSEKAGTTIGQSKGKGSPYVGRKLRSASGGIREKPGACPGYAATGPIERTLPEQDPRGDRVIGRNPLPLPGRPFPCRMQTGVGRSAHFGQRCMGSHLALRAGGKGIPGSSAWTGSPFPQCPPFLLHW